MIYVSGGRAIDGGLLPSPNSLVRWHVGRRKPCNVNYIIISFVFVLVIVCCARPTVPHHIPQRGDTTTPQIRTSPGA